MLLREKDDEMQQVIEKMESRGEVNVDEAVIPSAPLYKQWVDSILCKKDKGMFYIAQYPVGWIAQSALHFTPWQTCTFWHKLGSSGKHSSHSTITWRLFTHISTTIYGQVPICTTERTGAS